MKRIYILHPNSIGDYQNTSSSNNDQAKKNFDELVSAILFGGGLIVFVVSFLFITLGGLPYDRI